jgi:hypothetical protein
MGNPPLHDQASLRPYPNYTRVAGAARYFEPFQIAC